MAKRTYAIPRLCSCWATATVPACSQNTACLWVREDEGEPTSSSNQFCLLVSRYRSIHTGACNAECYLQCVMASASLRRGCISSIGQKPRQCFFARVATLTAGSRIPHRYRRCIQPPITATAAGVPANLPPAETPPAAYDAAGGQDPDQQQRELRPFLVPSPNRGIIGNSRYARRLRAQVVEAARDPHR